MKWPWKINRIAVLGSGVMGSQIACHLANAGFSVDLLDRVLEGEKGTVDELARTSLEAAIKMNPAPLFSSNLKSRIRTGNFRDHLPRLAEADWILECIIERREDKMALYEAIEPHRRPGVPVSTNTSGIPIGSLLQGRSPDFVSCFLGTHFFNPPRYLNLLEIIPSAQTEAHWVGFFMEFGRKFLGKTTVQCRDTPGFIANRIGVYSMMRLLHLMENSDVLPETIERFSGPLIGRPKSATFRTADVVGLDTFVKVAQGLHAQATGPRESQTFSMPPFLTEMVNRGWLGQKSGQGFFKKVRQEDGSSDIHILDVQRMEYRPQEKYKGPILERMKPLEDPLARLDILLKSADAPGPFFKELFLDLLSYSAEQMPIIAGEVYKVDEALKAGFGWSHGPFEIWDALGFDWVVSEMDLAGILVPDWIKAMQATGEKRFYTTLEGQVQYHSLAQGNQQPVPGKEGFIVLSNVYPEHTLWSNSGTRITNLGDGVLNLSFHTKMNSIGAEVIQGLHKAIDMAETEGWNGLVISNDGENFSAGANLALILMLAIEQEWDELNFAVKAFQKATMRLRYSSIPVVVAPHGLTLGGGCEMCLHADAIVASAETYIGLVEVGVGLIPGGGGSKEFAIRAANEFGEGGIRTNVLRNRFLTIGQAKVATSALQAFELGIFRPGLDRLVMNGAQRIGLAKQTVLLMAEAGYVRPQERTDIQVLGREGLGIVYAGANSMQAGHYISEHDRLISEKLGYVMCGGDLTQPSPVSEAYLLDLEREAFLSLLGTKPTLQRIQHMLKTGKPLRN